MKYALYSFDGSGEEKHFDSGDLVPIITGSCAIPGVFCPVKYKNMVLVDGGVSNNIPADVLKNKYSGYGNQQLTMVKIR